MLHLTNSFFIQMTSEKSKTECQLKCWWISAMLKICYLNDYTFSWFLCFNLTNCLLLVLYTFSQIIFIVYFPRYSLDFIMNWIVWISCNLVFKLFDCVIFISWIIFMTTYEQLYCQRQCFILFYYLDFGGIGFLRFFEIYKHSFVKSDFCQVFWSVKILIFLRTPLHETRSELKLVQDFTSG